MARNSKYTYDPSSGKWSKSVSETKSTQKTTPKKEVSTQKTNSSGNLTSKTSNKKNSKGSVEKKYNEIEIRTLSGTLNFIVTEQTIKLKAGDTVKLQGLGKYLSGRYYVQDITRQISSSGYSHSATLIKTDFGESLKVSSSEKKSKKTKGKKTTKSVSSVKKVKSATSRKTARRKYVVKKGDCIYNIAKKFYKDGRKYDRILDSDTGKVVNPKKLYVGQVLWIT